MKLRDSIKEVLPTEGSPRTRILATVGGVSSIVVVEVMLVARVVCVFFLK